MTITLAGNFPNLSFLEIMGKLKDLIVANWTETSPPVSDVYFDNDWDNDYGEFRVTIRNPVTNVDPENIGWTYMRNDMFVNIHIFVKQLTELHPTKAANMEKQIKEILEDKKLGLQSSGISYILPSSFQEIPENRELSTTTKWHSVMTVRLVYRQVKS